MDQIEEEFRSLWLSLEPAAVVDPRVLSWLEADRKKWDEEHENTRKCLLHRVETAKDDLRARMEEDPSTVEWRQTVSNVLAAAQELAGHISQPRGYVDDSLGALEALVFGGHRVLCV